MIPKENLLKENHLKFNGIYCRWIDVMDYLFRIVPFTREQSWELHQSFKSLGEENLIIPLDFIKGNHLPQDKKGCRIYDWKVLTNSQVKNAMKINGHFHKIVVPYVSMTSFLAQVVDNKKIPDMLPYEKYDKFLNVTYLVNDEFLQDWCNPNYYEKNVAKKEVKDCSVSELLFAIKKKLDNQN